MLQAASAEARYVSVRQALGGLRVRDLMAREPVTVSPDLTLGEFMDNVVWDKRYTSYPVVEDGTPVGLIPFRSVAEVPRREWDERHVRDVMHDPQDVPMLHEDDDAVEALAQLTESTVNRGLVLSGDELVGLLSMSDLARALEARPRRRRRSLRA